MSSLSRFFVPLFVLLCWTTRATASGTRLSRLTATVRRLSPTRWNMSSRAREARMRKVIAFLERIEEPQEEANPDEWATGFGKPFTGKNGVRAGGGEEPEFNYDTDPITALPNGATKGCNAQTGNFLKGCVYRSNTHLRTRTMDKCKADLSALAASCVFGPVKR